jgi:hypothetical protein
VGAKNSIAYFKNVKEMQKPKKSKESPKQNIKKQYPEGQILQKSPFRDKIILNKKKQNGLLHSKEKGSAIMMDFFRK